MPLDARRELEPAVGHGPHQVNASARAVVLVAGFEVGRTRRRAEAAVDAVQEAVVVDRSCGCIGHDCCTTEGTEDTEKCEGIVQKAFSVNSVPSVVKSFCQ